MDKLISFLEYFRKIPVTFLGGIAITLALILFSSDEIAQKLAVNDFRDKYRVFIGPSFLVVFSFFIARFFDFAYKKYRNRVVLKKRKVFLHNLTPEERGYLAIFVFNRQNSIYVGLEDGIMAGLCSKGITYRATNVGDVLHGFAFNLCPWAREYLEQNQHLLEGYMGKPITPVEKIFPTF